MKINGFSDRENDFKSTVLYLTKLAMKYNVE